MKNIIALLILAVSPAWAAEPVYPTTEVKGYIVRDFDEYYPFTFKPGALSNCQSNSSSGFTTYTCEAKGAEFAIDMKGTNRIFVVTNISAYEIAATATTPETLNYFFSLLHAFTLPDGTPFETRGSISLQRSGANPDYLTGNFEIYQFNMHGGVAAKWPETPGQ